MSSYTYRDTPNANLVCCICRSPFLDPCTTRTCCHTFCYECIARAITVSRQCPIDRCPLSMHDLAPADPVVRNLVDELIVECPQQRVGCAYTCQRLLLSAHLKDACEYVEVACPSGDCDSRILRKDAAAHNHPQSTDADGRGDAIEGEPSSSEASTSCGVNTTTPPCGPTPRVDDELATENALLRLRLSALEGVVHSLRHDMHAVQRALGPWYRPDDDSRTVHELEIEGHASLAAARASESGAVTDPPPHLPNLGSGAPQGSTPPSLSPPPAASASTNLAPVPHGDPSAAVDLSPYFPPAEDLSAYDHPVPRDSLSPRQSQPAHAQNPVSPSASSGQRAPHPHAYAPPPAPAYPFPAAYAPSPPHNPSAPYMHPYGAPGGAPFAPTAIAVPPLDPTTPLPNTLAALHAALGTLAGALAALASARAAEALRTGEEIRGVRAGMHGLRLQLHDVMTQRARDAAGASGPASDALPPPPGPAWLAHGPRAFGAPPPPPHAYAYPGKPALPASATKL